MTPISETLHELLVRQGIAQERTAIRQAQGIGAGAPEGTAHPLTARPGEDREPMGMGKTGAAKAPASFQEVGSIAREPSMARSHPVLRLVVSNKDVRRRGPTSVAPLGLRTSLVLVSSR